MKRSPGCTCCGAAAGDKVLLWDANCNAAVGGLSAAQDVYTDNSITAHLSSEWTGVISDYKTIIWLMAESEPSWLATVLGGSWSGRIHISAEFANKDGFNPGWPDTIEYVNTLTSTHKVTCAEDCVAQASGCAGYSSDPETHALTDGVAELLHVDACSLTSGDAVAVFTEPDTSAAVMMQYKNGTVDWVVAGDSSHIGDHCPTAAADNETFLLNLHNKPL